MITGATAKQMQHAGQAWIKSHYAKTRTFPMRWVANAQYRRELTAEVDMICNQQIDRVLDRLDSIEDYLPEIGDRMLLAEYDCEVRR